MADVSIAHIDGARWMRDFLAATEEDEAGQEGGGNTSAVVTPPIGMTIQI